MKNDNLPPGVTDSMIPGNRPPDLARDAAFEQAEVTLGDAKGRDLRRKLWSEIFEDVLAWPHQYPEPALSSGVSLRTEPEGGWPKGARQGVKLKTVDGEWCGSNKDAQPIADALALALSHGDYYDVKTWIEHAEKSIRLTANAPAGGPLSAPHDRYAKAGLAVLKSLVLVMEQASTYMVHLEATRIMEDGEEPEG